MMPLHAKAPRSSVRAGAAGSMGAASDDFTLDTAPVPLVFVIAASAGDMEQNSAETGLSEMSLHRIGVGCWD